MRLDVALLGDYAQYFRFAGVVNGALYQIEARGVWSKSDPSADCVWVQTTYPGQYGVPTEIYRPALINAALYYSPSHGVWDESSNGVSHVFSYGPQTAVNLFKTRLTGTSAFEGDGIVINAVDSSHHFSGPSYLYDEYANIYTAGVSMPGNNNTLICPT
jgi:hypothetical protein